MAVMVVRRASGTAQPSASTGSRGRTRSGDSDENDAVDGRDRVGRCPVGRDDHTVRASITVCPPTIHHSNARPGRARSLSPCTLSPERPSHRPYPYDPNQILIQFTAVFRFSVASKRDAAVTDEAAATFQCGKPFRRVDGCPRAAPLGVPLSLACASPEYWRPSGHFQRRCGLATDAHALWPEDLAERARRRDRTILRRHAQHPLEVLVPSTRPGRAVGCAELSIRNYAEDCVTDRVAYLEGWYSCRSGAVAASDGRSSTPRERGRRSRAAPSSARTRY